MKIIRSFKDISNKIEDGVSYDVYKASYNSVYSRKVLHPFEAIKAKDRFFMLLLSDLYVSRKIGLMDYYLSKFLFYIYWGAVSIRDIFSKNFRHWEFCGLNDVSMDDYDYVTCSKGIDRAKSYCFDRKDVYDVTLKKKYSNLRFLDRLKVISIMVSMRCYSYWHVAQLYILSKTKPDIKKIKTIVMEEGGDYVGKCFVYLLKEDDTKTVLTHSASNMSGLKRNEAFDVIITNNQLMKECIINCDVSIRLFPPNVDISQYRKRGVDCIGYAPDIGNPVLSINKKNTMDECFFATARNNKYSVVVTIHPQDKPEKYDDVIDGGFIKLRGDSSVEDFLGGVDVLVTWWSTLIFQSVYCGVPVVILDCDLTGHADDLVKHAGGFIKIASNREELHECIQYFRKLSQESLSIKYQECCQSLFNDSSFIHER